MTDPNDPALQASAQVLADLVDVDRRVSAEITRLLEGQLGRWAEHPVVDRALRSYRTIALSGGKRLRPALAYWAYQGAGGDRDDDVILQTATAVELLHTFALIHDDVMDEAPTRRGIETVHVTYAHRHREARGRGEGRHYGESIAVLLGDLAFVQSAEMVSRLPERCREVYFAMCADLMVGQLLDIEAAASGIDPERQVATRIADLKTSGYSVVGPLLLGAAAADRLTELRPHFEAYGQPLGLAFQLRDDLLGAFGDPDTTGKPVGEDLAQGKVTMLLEHGRERADADGRELLDRLGTDRMWATDVGAAADLLVACGARDSVEADIARLVAEATDAVATAPISTEARDALVAAAVLIAHRDR